MSTAPQYDVAISFAGQDRDTARALAWALRDAGVDVFFDEFVEDSLWGSDLLEYFERVFARDARLVVPLVSRHYKERAWPAAERQAILSRLIDSARKTSVLPVRIDDTRIDGLPSTIGFIPVERGTRAICDLLLAKLGRSRSPGSGSGMVGTARQPSEFRFFDVSLSGGTRTVVARVAPGTEHCLEATPGDTAAYFAERDYLLVSNAFVQWQSQAFLRSFSACVAVIRIARTLADVIEGIAAGGRDVDPAQTRTQITSFHGLLHGLQEARAILGKPPLEAPTQTAISGPYG